MDWTPDREDQITARPITSTYRLQLHHGFTFDDARSIIPYLNRLGITTVYCSPILKARPLSMHGYDVVDPTQINPELGGFDGFARLVEALHAKDMSLLLDIVPNHMAISPENHAWMSVLEHGRSSPFVDWFDIHWPDEGTEDIADWRLLVPVLGDELHTIIRSGAISLELGDDVFRLRYFDWLFPVDVRSWKSILEQARLKGEIGEGAACDQSLAANADAVPSWQDRRQAPARLKATAIMKRRLRQALAENSPLRELLNKAVHELNEASAREPDHGPIATLLAEQAYRPCYWKQAMTHLSYRRFFDITDLIGIRVEDPRVFCQTHKLLLRLVQMGMVDGLRIDHIDGLADPLGYLLRLQAALGDDAPSCPVYVEKILEGEEQLDRSWPVAGTTGYDFINALNGIFIDARGHQDLSAFHGEVVGEQRSFAEIVVEQKRRLAAELFGGELDALVHELHLLAHEVSARNVSEDEIRRGVLDLSARMPVYRTYGRDGRLPKRDREIVQACLDAMNASEARDLLRRVLLTADEAASPEICDRQRGFMSHWQQFTGPLMAKGLEDTALYRHAALISLNEVGVDPYGLDDPSTMATFHKHNAIRASEWPQSMTTTATHDTKRGEDVRACVAVLSEMSDQWIAQCRQWMQMNRENTVIGEIPALGAELELLLYQTALGAWPISAAEEADFIERLSNYAVKAAREAKSHTGWINPDEIYERGVVDSIRRTFSPENAEFMASFRTLRTHVAWFGALNSLSQTLIKLTSPGVPDTYQGTELWDFNLVDPDNRRPVDFSLAQEYLESVCGHIDWGQLVSSWFDGRMKLLVTHRGLMARRQNHALFLRGDYLPLELLNVSSGQVCAFARRHLNQWAITIAPVRWMSLVEQGSEPWGERVWKEASVRLPAGAPTIWRDVFTDDWHEGGLLHLRNILHASPVALLLSQADSCNNVHL